MKDNLLITIVIFMTVNVVLAQNRDHPSPQPGFGVGGGAPGLPGSSAPGGRGLNPPGGFPGGGFPGGGIPGGQPGLGGGVPGVGVVGGFPGGAGGGVGGPPVMLPGGMGGGMGLPGLGFGDMGGSNQFQLFAGEVVPAGKDKPLPMILKIDTRTGQVWQLQVGAQDKVRFVLIEGQPRQFNGPPMGFGGGGPALGIPGGGLGGVPVDPTTGLPLNGRPGVAPGPQTPPISPPRRPEF